MKATENVQLFPGSTVWPEQVSALKLNSLLFDESMPDTESAAPPVLVTTIVRGTDEFPICRLPKVKWDGDNETAEVTPIPVKATWSGDVEESDVISISPI